MGGAPSEVDSAQLSRSVETSPQLRLLPQILAPLFYNLSFFSIPLPLFSPIFLSPSLPFKLNFYWSLPI